MYKNIDKPKTFGKIAISGKFAARFQGLNSTIKLQFARRDELCHCCKGPFSEHASHRLQTRHGGGAESKSLLPCHPESHRSLCNGVLFFDLDCKNERASRGYSQSPSGRHCPRRQSRCDPASGWFERGFGRLVGKRAAGSEYPLLTVARPEQESNADCAGLAVHILSHAPQCVLICDNRPHERMNI